MGDYMNNNELKKEIKEDISLINKLIYKVKRINDNSSIQFFLNDLIEIKILYTELLNMIKKDKNTVEERQQNYELIYNLISKALIILLPKLRTIIDKRICERN